MFIYNKCHQKNNPQFKDNLRLLMKKLYNKSKIMKKYKKNY